MRRFRKDGVAIHNFSVAFALWIATLALLARNDGQRKRTLPFENGGGFCHFEPFAKRRPNGFQAQAAAKKIQRIESTLTIFGYFATLSMTRFRVSARVLKRYRKVSRNDGGICHFEQEK